MDDVIIVIYLTYTLSNILMQHLITEALFNNRFYLVDRMSAAFYNIAGLPRTGLLAQSKVL